MSPRAVSNVEQSSIGPKRSAILNYSSVMTHFRFASRARSTSPRAEIRTESGAHTRVPSGAALFMGCVPTALTFVASCLLSSWKKLPAGHNGRFLQETRQRRIYRHVCLFLTFRIFRALFFFLLRAAKRVTAVTSDISTTSLTQRASRRKFVLIFNTVLVWAHA